MGGGLPVPQLTVRTYEQLLEKRWGMDQRIVVLQLGQLAQDKVQSRIGAADREHRAHFGREHLMAQRGGGRYGLIRHDDQRG